MCRLAYITRPFDGLTDWLRQLEKSCGGDGNGAAVGKAHVKGVKLSVEHTVGFWHDMRKAHQSKKLAMPPMLWHTRRTSSGGDCDELCHPFECDGGWLVHNGHWQMAHERANRLTMKQPMSDTRFFSMVVDELGFEKAVEEFTPPGVWLHMLRNGQLSVFKGSGQLVYSPDLDAWGSEPASVGEWFTVDSGLLYGYGEKPERSEASVAKLHEVWWDKSQSGDVR
jgi:hypothetical protein